MPLTIQATTISGTIVESARWRVESTGMLPGDLLQLRLPVKDRKLMEYIRKQSKFECMLERGQKDENDAESDHAVIMAFRVKQMRHMLDSQTSEIESMCVVTPMDRFVESVMMFLLDRKKCDPRFIAMIRNPRSPQE